VCWECLPGKNLLHCRCQLGSGLIERAGGQSSIWGGAYSYHLELCLRERKFRGRGYRASVLVDLGSSSWGSGACCSN